MKIIISIPSIQICVLTKMIYTSIYLNIFLCLLLLNFQWKENRSILYLCIGLIIFNVRLITGFLLNTESNNIVLTKLLFVLDPIVALTGPITLYYFKSLIEKKFYIDFKFILLCLIPGVLIIINLWPYYHLSFDEKLNTILAINNHAYIRDVPVKHTLLFSFKIHTRLIAIYNAAHLLYALYYLIKENKANKFKVKSVKIILSVISIILISILPVVLFLGYFSYTTSERFDFSFKITENVNLDLFYTFTLITPISFLFFPQLIYGVNPNTALHVQVKDAINCILKPKSDDVIVELEKSCDKDRIVEYINQQKPYLNPSFSLHTVSSELNIPHLRVSSCFNKELNISFPEYRNQKRVEYAIQLFKEKKHFQMSIEGISDQCGFKSKSSFYQAFRSVHQMTPTDWIAKNM